MLSTSGNPLNAAANSNVTNNSNTTNPTKSNLLSASGLINSADFMLPTINNLTNNNNPMATTSSYLNDYNKLYRDVGLFQSGHQAAIQQQQQQQQQQQSAKQQQTANLIGQNLGNSTLNNLVVNNITSSLNSLNNLGNHANNLNTIQSHTNNLNGLPGNHLNNLTSANATNKQQQQQPPQQQPQLINNPDFVIYLNRCNQFLELSMYQQALDEINHALNLVSNSALARFRKAQSLLGLKRFYECEKELWNCINLEPNVLEYRKELLKVKQLALMSLNLNLDHNTILMAAQKYDSIKDAVDALMWSNNMIDFNYGNQSASFQTAATPTNNNLTNDTTSLMNGWNLNLNANQQQATANNRFGSINQLMNNGSNLLFNNGLMSNNLLLNNAANLVNRSNNGTAHGASHTNNVIVTNSTVSAVQNLKQSQASTSISNNSTLNNLINTNNSTASVANNSNSTSVTTNQQTVSNSPLNDPTTPNLTNGLSSLSNGNNRFNYLLRGLDQTHHSMLSAAANQQSTNGQNSNQNLINNQAQQQQQQQLYNRMLPSFIDNNPNNNSSTVANQQQQSKGNQAVLNCTRNLSKKLTLNDPQPSSTTSSILNGTNGLLMMNNGAPSPICSKLNPTPNSSHPNTNNNNSSSNSNLSTNSSASLTNSCNYNIFNQMPEMKLIETIVPNLLGTLGNSSSLNNHTASSSNNGTNLSISITNHNKSHNNSPITVATNNSSANDLTSSTSNHKLLASLAGKEVNNNVKDNLVNNLQQSQETVFDDCNKSANKSKTDLISDKLITPSDLVKLDYGVVDLKSSNSCVKDDCGSLLITNLTTTTTRDQTSIKNESLDNQTSALVNQQQTVTNCSPAASITSTANSVVSSAISSTPPANSMQCTSYSDIVKRAKKITQQSITANGGGGALSGATTAKDATSNSTTKPDNETAADDTTSIASKRPTNLWGYNGLRVANVSLTASKTSLMSLFSKFGRIRLLERIINKTTTNNIWVYYDNSISPVDAVTKLQNVYLENICVDSESPLRLFFAPTDDQKDLKFSRPKQPPDNKGECYYWRTTNCFSKEQCPLLHIQANKNIDAQVRTAQK